MTVTNYVVRYQEHVSSKPYDELLAPFEEGIGDGSGLSASALREAFINDGSARIGYDLPPACSASSATPRWTPSPRNWTGRSSGSSPRSQV